ncbi:MAG TPA: DUF4136 domain-containing protein [Chryseolinea sp.]|nr:DUF4136 domain-containing protein [Chryseolinea sp.]
MIKKILFTGLITGMLAGCHPGGAEFVDEVDLVLTTHQNTYDFGTANTFSMPDKIPVVTGSLLEGEEIEYLEAPKAELILDQIMSNMESRGYVYVEDAADADLVILPATISTTTIVTYCDYWGDYWGWYYPYYGGCYYPSAYAYTTGSVLIQMIENDNSTAVVNVWGAAVNGLLQGSDASIASRVQKGIDQAFAQSAYIKTN